MRSFGTVFVRSYSLLFHPKNVQNIRTSVENGEMKGESKNSNEPNSESNSGNPENDTNLSHSFEDKSVFCSHCGNRLGSFIDEREPNFAIELLKDRIRLESKPFYSTIRRIFVELLDFYRWKYHFPS